MLSFFKSQASKDFDRAMDYLDCSRILMGSAIETHRAITESDGSNLRARVELAAVVRPAYEFLTQHLEAISGRLVAWKLYMQMENPARYSRIEHIVVNAEKNMHLAREKAVHIDHWVRFDMLGGSLVR